MTIIQIPLAQALELLQGDDKTIELHAAAPGVEIRIPYSCTLEGAGPPPDVVAIPSRRGRSRGRRERLRTLRPHRAGCPGPPAVNVIPLKRRSAS